MSYLGFSDRTAWRVQQEIRCVMTLADQENRLEGDVGRLNHADPGCFVAMGPPNLTVVPLVARSSGLER
jgi:hypothetical protein